MKIGVGPLLLQLFYFSSRHGVGTTHQNSHPFRKKLNVNYEDPERPPVMNPSGILTNINAT